MPRYAHTFASVVLGCFLLTGPVTALRLVPAVTKAPAKLPSLSPTVAKPSQPSAAARANTLPEILPVGTPISSGQVEILPVNSAQPLPGVQSKPQVQGQVQIQNQPGLPAAWPSDPLFPYQWDMQAIGVTGAWAQLPAALRNVVTVAVLDTGYVNSPELAGRLINGYDFVHDANRAGDGNGRDKDAAGRGEFAYHAEVIANIIAAAHGVQGMAGINPQARVVQVRVAGTDGLIDPVDLIDGLRWAAGLPVAGVPANPNPARIINVSLFADFIALTGCDPRIQRALDEVATKGTLVVAGAANDGRDATGYSPAGCRNVLTDTSVNQDGQRPAYANWGKTVALAAPGGEPGHGIVASSVSGPNGQRSPDGTSFAAPHVTGVASLLLGVRPKLTPAQLRDLLTSTATPFAGGRCDPDPLKTCGSGMLDAQAALKKALASGLGK